VTKSDYFIVASQHGLRSGDWILGNCRDADGHFCPVILVVTSGGERRSATGQRLPIEVEVLVRPRRAAMGLAA
jgi:hypothetical protein